MTTGRYTAGLAVLLLAVVWAGCTSKKASTVTNNAGHEADVNEIKSVLHETAVRWAYRDKSVLYEQEFKFLREGMDYDSYLDNSTIKRMQSDTVADFQVKDVRFLDGDSASVDADVVFVGPTGDTTRLPQTWIMHHYEGHWIRPTLSSRQDQTEWDERRRLADSAADAEEGLGKDDW